jgi:hypothetical protein
MDADVARALERLPGDHRAFLFDFLRLADDRPGEEQPSAAPGPDSRGLSANEKAPPERGLSAQRR